MKSYIYLLLVFFVFSCASTRLPDKVNNHVLPIPMDTHDKPIEIQTKQIFNAGTVMASNDFPAARMNNFFQINPTTFRAIIKPENKPINPSPWYAFQIWSETPQEVDVEIFYPDYRHRYYPVISHDGENWQNLDSSRYSVWTNNRHATLRLTLDSDPLWVAAQEIHDYRRVGDWVERLAQHPLVTRGSGGKSAQGRDLYFLNITEGSQSNKPAIIVMGRQHPPEITGHLAMQAFMEQLIEEGAKNGFFKKYRVLFYPMINPDGVDMGHWRHNTGGIDLNRDWAYYRQPETRNITKHIVDETYRSKNDVILGLDFHSTQEDVFYTFPEDLKRKLPGFTKMWLEEIRVALDQPDTLEEANSLNQPISKAWFVLQFGADSITYEMGDDTPRDFIKRKGEVSADALMKLLLNPPKAWK